MDLRQRTVAEEISCTGIGLHSGKKVRLTIKPAPPNSGITFERVDISPGCSVKASFDNVVETNMATTIGFNGYSVSTIEHIMAAFFGMGIDNVLVQIDGGEIPIMDGSSAPFIFLLKNAGITIQNNYKRFLLVKKSVKVKDGNRFVYLYPANELKITYKIDFNHPLIKDQTYEISFSQSTFVNEISRARTFGFLRDVQTLRNNGLAKGGSLDNAIVVDEFRVLNEDGLRYKNEFVRHKLLDFIGDLAIIGCVPIGHFVVERSGHSLNQKLLKQFMAQEKCWEVIRFKNKEECGRKSIKIPSFGALDLAPA
ncbi:MAG: UDP-3-O-acyl-N-acetylglucosamine deacetylase [Desulfobacteraceae bacterium]|jgi:UDP-3-O-[3-hydroxymyristoyl] N-acetylglucosamine deacetylase|nr:MAG: UDP-3-O-[3-hydroxymyristoyl] N-acetylglucosamine deacetylase [Deltaproteobacteria bacterium]TET93444.1 MAG: UDP-3-O-acyl-N-acetylglucosamine deacetylase [Desulfobacteraceae bacterium]